MSNAKERSKVCNQLAFECYQTLEPKLDEIANQLESNIEINHFLACLNNRLAVLIAMKFNVKENPLKGQET
jgi:hypothetical protein